MFTNALILRRTALLGFTAFMLISAPFLTAAAGYDGPATPFVAPPPPKFTDAERQAELGRRRAAVAAKMADNSVLVLISAEPKLYTNDVNYVFRQENNLFYLTNLSQEDTTLVITKSGGKVREAVFLAKRDPRAEVWTGKMYSTAEAAAISGINTIIDAAESGKLWGALSTQNAFKSEDSSFAVDRAPSVVYALLPFGENDGDGTREFAREQKIMSAFPKAVRVENARPMIAVLREIKSPYELAMLRYAIDVTTEAQMRAMTASLTAKSEYEIQAEIEYTIRRRNADFWGYPSIVGAGPNATTLHYEKPQSAVRPGDLVLTDAAAEYQHYTADVTRTFPSTGKYTKEQREIYQIVFDAQEAAIKTLKPGSTMGEATAAANKVIRDGLFRLGLITNPDSSQYRLWFMHGLGHSIGMNVHDVGDSPQFKAGMVFTIEPGIYIRQDALDNLPDTPETKAFIAKVRPAFEKYKNIGVRIEDDLLITQNGSELLTKRLPRRLADIESLLASGNK